MKIKKNRKIDDVNRKMWPEYKKYKDLNLWPMYEKVEDLKVSRSETYTDIIQWKLFFVPTEDTKRTKCYLKGSKLT